MFVESDPIVVSEPPAIGPEVIFEPPADVGDSVMEGAEGSAAPEIGPAFTEPAPPAPWGEPAIESAPPRAERSVTSEEPLPAGLVDVSRSQASSSARAPAPPLEPPVPVGPAAEPNPSVAPAAALSLPVEQLQKLMTDGTQRFGEGNYEEAAGQFTKVVQADPSNVDAVLALAVARFATGHYGESAGLIRRGTKMMPEVVDTVFDLRDRYGKTDDFGQQVQGLELWVQQHPEDIEAHVVLGFVYHFTGQRPWAAEVFDYLKQASPADAPLADVFLKAKPLADAGPADAAGQPSAPAEAPAGSAADAPAGSAVDAPVGSAAGSSANVTPAAPVGSSSEPAAKPAPPTASALTGAGATVPKVASPGVSAAKPPASTSPVFEGRVARDKRAGPQELATIDGIIVKLKKTGSQPPTADLELRVGKFKEQYDKTPAGKRIIVFGESNAMYILEVTAIDPQRKAVTFTLQQAPRGNKAAA